MLDARCSLFFGWATENNEGKKEHSITNSKAKRKRAGSVLSSQPFAFNSCYCFSELTVVVHHSNKVRLYSAQQRNNFLRSSYQGVGIGLGNTLAALGFDGIDEGLQGIDGCHVIVGVDVVQ